MKPYNDKKIALAHDFLTVWGGAERVFRVMTEMYPEAPIYTLYYDADFVQRYFPGRTVRTSFLQRWPKRLRESSFGRLFYPVAVETLDLRDFDTVLSSSGAWMKGLVTRLHTRHIAYLHSPMRYVWDTTHEHPGLTQGFHFFKRMMLTYLRLWDKEAADRPDLLLVNSRYTLQRVKKYYRRGESQVVYPPLLFSEKNLDSQDRSQYPFLVVARLTASKHIDVIIEAFNKLGLPLCIVGDGPDRQRLQSLAKNKVTFLGMVSDERLSEIYSQSRALVQASEEDFGLAVLEAQSFGVPVIAFQGGAIEEIVTAGKTGEVFVGLVPETVADGVRRSIAHERAYDFSVFERERFSRDRFESMIRTVVDQSDEEV
ncbi:MAG: glycosyltransferase family 4 protein [Candidatus Moraniibacteriota bacterium]|nr:MAG: glycosyltransferase family 4 protein [Candidatus Moranbacteria bacterium]